MYNKFEKVFHKAMVNGGYNNWYELFDSMAFEAVEAEIISLYGDSEEFREWVAEMAADL